MVMAFDVSDGAVNTYTVALLAVPGSRLDGRRRNRGGTAAFPARILIRMTTTPSTVARLPATPGVYRFRDARGRVLYIGRAKQLRRRVASYWADPRDRRHLAAMVARVARIEAVACDSGHEAAWLERNLLEHARPAWNRTAGGQEVPVCIGLDTRPAAPGLRVVHGPPTSAGMRYFGPYLGGDKVRLAVAALHRVLPLAYTGTGLSGAGRDLAGNRGLGPGDRDRLVDALTAVLRRDPAAVASLRDALGTRRDRAAEVLAFELAARLHAELHAVDWITSPQRVTTAEPRDADVYGWADGLLVRFQIRAGRLCTWTQRACLAANARRHLAATPPAWTDFAHRNAELAARLAR
jgi:excinuclease ABC subunit C